MIIYRVTLFRNNSEMLQKPISNRFLKSLDFLQDLSNVLVDNTFLTSVGNRWVRHIVTTDYVFYITIGAIL